MSNFERARQARACGCMKKPMDTMETRVTDPRSLNGKVAVVTGGARGIGHAIATVLTARGASCILVDVLDQYSESSVAVLNEAGGSAAYRHLDVTDPGAVREAMTAIRAERGAIDILVTSAGVALHGPSVDVDYVAWSRVQRVNVDGTFLSAREAARVMIADGRPGSIVMIGSISGEVANLPQAQTAYNSSKGAVHVMAKCLAVEWTGHGIRVNVVAPGFVGTDLTKEGVPPEWIRAWEGLTPQGRLGKPSEIAEVVAFLASDAASYITGAVVAVDGGYLAR